MVEFSTHHFPGGMKSLHALVGDCIINEVFSLVLVLKYGLILVLNNA